MTVSPANLLEPTTLPGKGRSFITKQAVKAGELLLSVEPYAAVPDTKHTDLLCSHCQSLQGVTSKMVDGERILNRPSALKQSEDSGKSGPNVSIYRIHDLSSLLTPASQKLWWYCSSTQCEQQDLPYRSFEQSFFSVPANWKRFNQFTDYTKDYVRLLIRCLIRRWYESKGDALSSTIDGDGMLFDKDVMALCTNRSGFPADRMTEFKSVSEFLHEFLECTGLNGIDGKEKLTVDQLVDLVCREECNSFGLYSFIEDAAYGEPKYAYGLALYPQAAYFNHSCAPNVVHRTASAVAGKKQMFYAVCDIAEGKELCISYISLTNCYEVNAVDNR